MSKEISIHNYEQTKQWQASLSWIVDEYLKNHNLAQQEQSERKAIMILVKAVHTHDVVEQLTLIYKLMEESDSLPKELSFLPSVIMALLHDVARPGEAFSNGAFNDKGYDHGDIGADMVLNQSPLSNDDIDDFNQVIKAIEGHNKIEALDDHPYSLLIRDADKLGILTRIEYYVNPDHPGLNEKGDNLTLDLDQIIADAHDVDHKLLKTRADKIVQLLFWYLDLNYDVSKELFFEYKIPEIIFELLEEGFEKIEDEVQKKESLKKLENIKRMVLEWEKTLDEV